MEIDVATACAGFSEKMVAQQGCIYNVFFFGPRRVTILFVNVHSKETDRRSQGKNAAQERGRSKGNNLQRFLMVYTIDVVRNFCNSNSVQISKWMEFIP